jgi:hypothetical protein
MNLKKFVSIICLAFLAHFLNAQTINIYCSPSGASSGNGASLSTPVSLSQARVVVKTYPNNPCVVWLLDGAYTSRLVLDATDSRTANAPVTYKSLNPDKAVFQILSTINRASFQAIPDSIKNRIVDNTAKNNVVQLDLTSLGLSNMNVWPDAFEVGTINWPIFYKDTIMLPIAQYPNDTVMLMDSVLNNGSSNSVPGGTFKYKDQRTDKWVKAITDAGLWLKGNWRVPWEMTFLRVSAIDINRDTIQFAKNPNNGIGDKYTRPYGNFKEPYVAINLLEEIDKEGEWAINFKTKMLYIWPPASGSINYSSDVTAYPISLTNVNYTNFENIAVRSGSGGAVSLNNCNYVRVAGMDIAYCFEDAIAITGGTNCLVTSNDMHDLGQGGVIVNPLSATQFYIDQNNLTPNNHKIVNNHIYNFAQQVPVYSAAVNLNGVIGSYVANNKIHGTPHVGILYDGNNNVIDYNEFYDIIKVYNDMGAIYSNGYGSYKSFGNKIHYNYVHDSPQSKGSMFDNTKGGDSSSYNIDANNYWANQNSSGTFNVYTNSIIVNDNPSAVAILPTDTTISSNTSNAGKIQDSLSALWARSSAFQVAYPQLIDLVGPTINKAYTSRIWPRFTCNVLISNVAGFSGLSDANLFNSDGTTNTTYAQTSSPFTTYRSVFANNTKLTGILTNKISPFLIDSLKKTSAFSKTCNTDWHINRIGLYIDSFRTSIAFTDSISGIAPTVTSSISSNNSYHFPTILTLSVKAKNPNITGCISSVKFFDNGTEITGLSITTQSSNFDSVTYVATWSSATIGNHNINAVVYDAPNWQYSSNVTALTVQAPLPLQLLSFSGSSSNCTTTLKWLTTNEVNVDRFEVESSIDGSNFVLVNTVTAKCNNSQTTCNYQAEIPQQQSVFYRLKMIDKDGTFLYSQVISIQADCYGQSNLKLYPNPVINNSTTLSIFNTASIQNATLVIANVLGIDVMAKKLVLNKGINYVIINTSDLSTGLYWLKVITTNNNIPNSIKLVVNK